MSVTSLNWLTRKSVLSNLAVRRAPTSYKQVWKAVAYFCMFLSKLSAYGHDPELELVYDPLGANGHGGHSLTIPKQNLDLLTVPDTNDVFG